MHHWCTPLQVWALENITPGDRLSNHKRNDLTLNWPYLDIWRGYHKLLHGVLKKNACMPMLHVPKLGDEDDAMVYQVPLLPIILLSVHVCTVPLGLQPVTKIKTTKINSDSYFRLFMKIGTPENYLPYGITSDGITYWQLNWPWGSSGLPWCLSDQMHSCLISQSHKYVFHPLLLLVWTSDHTIPTYVHYL